MKFKLKSILCIILIFFITCAIPINVLSLSKDKTTTINSDIELDINSTTCQPPNFRKSTDTISNEGNLNLNGLSILNISGSGQFSKEGFSTIRESIDNKYNLIDIDLRQEAHGFLNGYPINWPRTHSNPDSSLKEIMINEKNKLDSIKLNKPLSFYNVPCKVVIPSEVNNEKEFVSYNKIFYIRFPVIDGSIPTEDTTNMFVDFVSKQPKNSWLHFHCKEGIGRTTTFMIMYDILKNGKTTPLDDIINRQIELAKMKTDEKNSFLFKERLDFLTDFYNKHKDK